MNDNEFDKVLSGAMKRLAKPADDAAVDRVLKRLAEPLPRQHRPVGQMLGVLLDWQFAPAWPRMAALAASLAFGFAIGISGLDRTIDHGQGASSADAGALVFEPESLTGGRP
jgi:hypothetical protein